jgi:hypothetical protein
VRWCRSPCVEVTNQHYGVLAQMQDRWGGSIRLRKDGTHVWTLYGRKALFYLSCVARYSVIKYPQIVSLFAAVRALDIRERLRHLRHLKRLKHEYTH